MKTMPATIFALFIALLMPSKLVQAAPDGLYVGEVKVVDQSLSEQARAMPLALAQVLQKLTGLREFKDFPELESSLQNARAMAITFYYRNKEMTLPDGSRSTEPYLLVEFSRPAVDGLSQSMQLPIWKSERRPLTVWMVIDDGLSRRIMPIELEFAWQQIADVAAARGMPIIRPQPDAEGVYPVDVQLLWGGYTEDLVETGPVDALVIAGRREGPDWNIRMNLDYMGQMWSWRNRDTDIQIALVDGMHTAIDEISAINSIAASDQGQWTVEINVLGVLEQVDYERCLAYLQEVSLIDSVDIAAAAAGMVRFELNLNASPEHLARALDSDGILAVTPTEGEYLLLP